MRFAVITFPGSNCDMDMFYAIRDVIKSDVNIVRHSEDNLDKYDVIILPGGFTYGDYLRSGAMAALANIIPAVKKASDQNKPIIGVCNGFQILTEIGLLPGVLLRNKGMKFISSKAKLKVVNANTVFTREYDENEIIDIPIAHSMGNYYTSTDVMDEIKQNNQVVFKYVDNQNGSLMDIAGIVNKKGNVLGMMPHPERAVEAIISGTDGIRLFDGVVKGSRNVYSN